MNKLHIGMTKDEVINAIGTPDSTAAQGAAEYLEYQHFVYASLNHYEYFYVRLINGKVDSYGRRGDFDSTKPPTQKIQIEKKTVSDE